MPVSNDNGSYKASDAEGVVAEYLKRAAEACKAGDSALGMHLYLAAYGFADKNLANPNEGAISGLKRAWSVACNLGERALAEYIFEKMEPYLSADELDHCANQLQELALDKLEEYGLPREALQGMSELFSQDLGGMGAMPHIMHVEKLPGSLAGAAMQIDLPFNDGVLDVVGLDDEADSALDDVADTADEASETTEAARVEASEAAEAGADTEADQPALDLSQFDAVPEDSCVDVTDGKPKLVGAQASSDDSPEDALKKAFSQVKARMVPQAATTGVTRTAESLDYASITGYAQAIDNMNALGIGVASDPDFQALVQVLNERHGLDRMPAADTLLFRAPAREDAQRFLQATLGEIGLPSLRMSMEENAQGMPVLCVMANASNHPKMNAARNAFEAPAVLVIEDVDLWSVPQADQLQGEGFEALVLSQMSRGAREALTLIHNSVENPDVYVLASLSTYGEVDPFFCDLLAPFTVVEIENPSEDERRDMWTSLAKEHPSLSDVAVDDLVRLSANLSRADIYLAAREAIEESYKESLATREYAPIKPENIFEKLSAYQPLDSEEYRALEDSVVSLLRSQLDGSVDDFLGL